MLVKKLRSTVLRILYDIVDQNTIQYLVSVLDNPVVTEITTAQYGSLLKLINHTRGRTLTAQEQNYIIDAFERLFAIGTNLWVVDCYSNAGVDLTLTLEDGDSWSGYNITAREDVTQVLVGVVKAGTEDVTQTIELGSSVADVGFQQATDTIFKVKIGLEVTTGDVVRVVDDFFLLIKNNTTDAV